jgi:hypothetical protein
VLSSTGDDGKIVYWHRDLPPIDGEMLDEARLGGDCAHVLDEHIDSRRDDLTNESWLQGRFNYVLYRRSDHA